MKLPVFFLLLVLIGSLITDAGAEGAAKLIPVNEVEWQKLNPARGDKSPLAATLWGDRNGSGPTGFLVKFIDGFLSPPHIHNVSYQGVVVSGLIHNDDPTAEKNWMPKGSFWTQPRGGIHVTGAKGEENIAYIEIEEGPYLVLPIEEAYDSGEQPIKARLASLEWHGVQDDGGGSLPSSSWPSMAFLWGDLGGDQLNGILVKLPAGVLVDLISADVGLRAVVINGELSLKALNASEEKLLVAGSYFELGDQKNTEAYCDGEEECLLYVRSKGELKIKSHELEIQVNRR